MWHVATEAEIEAMKKHQMEQLRQARERELAKHAARKRWKEKHTCEHCGQCAPLPPWLQ